jgi:hypothetical protein
VTEITPVGSASDVQNVNPYTQGFMSDLAKQIQGLQGASDPLAAFMGALPNLFGSAINMSNPYTQAVNQYRTAATQSVKENAMEPWADTPYGSGPSSALARAFGEFETGLGEKILGMQTNLGNSLAGYGAGLLGQQTGLLGQLMGYQSQAAAPEWWQPTYMEKNTPFGDVMGALGPIAGIASMFIPGMQGAAVPSLLGLLGMAGQHSVGGN